MPNNNADSGKSWKNISLKDRYYKWRRKKKLKRLSLQPIRLGNSSLIDAIFLKKGLEMTEILQHMLWKSSWLVDPYQILFHNKESR